MKKKGYKTTSCTKRQLSKCTDKFCKTFSKLESNYADMLQANADVKEFRCNVLLEGLDIGEYTSDFVAVKMNGDLMVRECFYRKHIKKPMNLKLMNASYRFWVKRGVTDWGIVIDKEVSDGGALS